MSVQAELAKLREELDDQSTVRSANALLLRDLQKATAENSRLLGNIAQLTQGLAKLNEIVAELRGEIRSLSAQQKEAKPARSSSAFDAPLDELGLSVRTYNALKKAGIQTVQQLIDKQDWELLRIKNLGRLAFNEVRAEVGRYMERCAPEPAPTFFEMMVPLAC